MTVSLKLFGLPGDHLGPLLLLLQSEVVLRQEVLDDAVEAGGARGGGQGRGRGRRGGRGSPQRLAGEGGLEMLRHRGDVEDL